MFGLIKESENNQLHTKVKLALSLPMISALMGNGYSDNITNTCRNEKLIHIGSEPKEKNELTDPASNSFAFENKDFAVREHNNNLKHQHCQPKKVQRYEKDHLGKGIL